jgi:hypothetical protein
MMIVVIIYQIFKLQINFLIKIKIIKIWIFLKKENKMKHHNYSQIHKYIKIIKIIKKIFKFHLYNPPLVMNMMDGIQLHKNIIC